MMNSRPEPDFFSDAQIRRSLPWIIAVVVIFIFGYFSTFIVPPGHRGVLVTLGKVSPFFAPEGFGIKLPFVTTMVPISIRQQTQSIKSAAYSSDLQQINIQIDVLFRIPETAVVKIYREFLGDPFDSLVSPRVNEALKEATALQSAEMIVQKREAIKLAILGASKRKLGTLLNIEDVVITDVTLSGELEAAIEAKMVQEQEASKARFIQQKSKIEAETNIIRARGEAESIRIRGEALRENPALIQLQIVEKWNGVSPLVIGGGQQGGGQILLPLGDLKK